MMKWVTFPQNKVFKFKNKAHLANDSTNRKESQQGGQDKLLKRRKKCGNWICGSVLSFSLYFSLEEGVALGKDLNVGLSNIFSCGMSPGNL